LVWQDVFWLNLNCLKKCGLMPYVLLHIHATGVSVREQVKLHMRVWQAVFGTTCFASVQNEKKLDPRSEKGIFIGYDSESRAYLVYFKESDTVRKVRCVRFTNRFDDISSIDTSVSVDDSACPEWKSDTKSDVSGENIQHEHVVTDTSASQNNDVSVQVETPSVTSHESTRRYPQRNTKKPKYSNDYVVEDDSVSVTIHYCYKMCDVPKKERKIKKKVTNSDISHMRWDPHAAWSLPYLEVKVGPRCSYAPQVSWRSLQGFSSQG